MPDLQEVFRSATQEVKPDPGALERQHRGQRRRVVRRKASVYVLVAALIAVGAVIGSNLIHLRGQSTRPATMPDASPGGSDRVAATPEELAPTVDRLAGIWLLGGDLLLRFGPDGTFAFIPDGEVGGFGTYEVEDRTISFLYTGGRFCGGSFEWEAGLPADGRLRAVNIRSTSNCYPEHQVGLETNWTRVSPTSRAAAQLFADVSPEELGRLSPRDWSTLALGIWLEPGSGTLVRFRTDGSYALDDGGDLLTDPDDVGTFMVDRNGSIEFTSGRDSRECSKRDVVVWEDVQVGAVGLRAVATEDGCGRKLGPDLVWVRTSSHS
jgi:hypothetical protein